MIKSGKYIIFRFFCFSLLKYFLKNQMKRIITLLSVFALFVSSCSSSDETPVETPVDVNSILLKKSIFDDGTDVVTAIYEYNGNKISKVTYSNNSKSIYTYTGNLITKKEHFNGTILDYTENFTYDSNNNLITYTDISATSGYKETYVHNSNGEISYNAFTGNAVSQTTPANSGVFSMQNGEVISKTVVVGGNTSTYNYVYESKNGFFKNVLNFNKISFRDDYLDAGNQKVRYKTTFTNPSFPSSNYTQTLSHTYDFNNFPITENKVVNGIPQETTKFFY